MLTPIADNASLDDRVCYACPLITVISVSHSLVPDSLWPPWTAAHQAPLSTGFSRQEYWSALPFPSPGRLPDPGIETASLVSPALAGGFFTTSATWWNGRDSCHSKCGFPPRSTWNHHLETCQKCRLTGWRTHYPKIWNLGILRCFLARGAWESSRNGKVTLTFPLTHLPWTQNPHVRDDFPMPGAKRVLVSKDTETLRRIWTNRLCQVSPSLCHGLCAAWKRISRRDRMKGE